LHRYYTIQQEEAMRFGKYVACIAMLASLFAIEDANADTVAEGLRASVTNPVVMSLMLLGFSMLGISAILRYRRLRREILRL